MKLERPLVVFDCESTGVNPASDRIISFAALKLFPDGAERWIESMFNPERPIPPESTEVHGITDDQVQGKPVFSACASEVHLFLSDCDLAGFNLLNFDIPIVWEELYRAGVTWDLTGVQVLDAGNIFKKKEERSLEAAVQFYLNRKHDSAHNARGDVDATRSVLFAQLVRYADLSKLNAADLATFCRFDDRVDLAGKIVRDKEGCPIYNIGKSKGVRVKDDPGMAYWMLDRDFPQQTKLVLQRILDEQQKEERGMF